MTDAAHIPFGIDDRASAGVRKIRTEVDHLDHSAKRAQHSVDHLGKHLAKDVLGRGGSKAASGVMAAFGGGMAMGVTGAALAAAGMALGGVESWDERRVELARARVEHNHRRAEMTEKADEARRTLAAGGMTFAGSLRRMLSRGGSMSGLRDLANNGIEMNDAIAGESELADVSQGARAKVSQQARRLAATGEISYADAVRRMAKFGGGDVSLERELLAIRGQSQSPENMASASRALRWGGGSEARGLDVAQGSSSQIGLAQADDLLSGKTTEALRQQASETLDPLAHALHQYAAQQERAAELLQAAAEAQSGLVAFMKDIGSLVGGEGSARSKLSRFHKAAEMGGD